MTYTIEVLLKGQQHPVIETVQYGPDPVDWTEKDVRAVLTSALGAVDRQVNPAAPARDVALRGLSWIVTPYERGVAIAIEIPSGAVVVGPFDIAESRLTEMITRVLHAAAPASGRVH